MSASSGSARSARVPLFAPKVMPPRVQPGTVPRESLVRRLCTSDATEIFISAPAGYGKSTLVTLWDAVDERPFGWMMADEGDKDPVVLLTYLALALDAIDPERPSLFDELSAAALPWPAMLAIVTDAVAAIPDPFVLVVDDVHHLEGPSGAEVLPAIARRVPPGSALTMITRSRKPYPASRSLLAGRMLQLGTEELAMDADESALLLRAAGVETSRAGVDALRDRTEGWPAGLYISALAWRNADEPSQVVQQLLGPRPRHDRLRGGRDHVCAQA